MLSDPQLLAEYQATRGRCGTGCNVTRYDFIISGKQSDLKKVFCKKCFKLTLKANKEKFQESSTNGRR